MLYTLGFRLPWSQSGFIEEFSRRLPCSPWAL